jgi:P27 family predicted phage terminase small subunit
MPGPSPLPTKIKKLTGNRGKRPLNANEPEPLPLINKEPPEHLNDMASGEWERMYPELSKLGLITTIDVTAFEGYCIAYSIWREALKKLNDEGMITEGDNGIPYQSPYLKIQNQQLKIVQSFLNEFGMTPASRSRVAVVTGKKKESKFDED